MTTVPPIRYMGTKKLLVPAVHRVFDSLPRKPSRVIDLFAGTGAIAASMENQSYVTCGDALEFPTLLARARFLRRAVMIRPTLVEKVFSQATNFAVATIEANATTIRDEVEAMAADPGPLARWIDEAATPANSAHQRAAAKSARTGNRYELALMYFSRGYFSTTQAIWIDAIRQAIDVHFPPTGDRDTAEWAKCTTRDVLLAAWIVAISRICNGPGHTAQFLHGKSETGHSRVVASWNRSVLDEFQAGISAVCPIGSTSWRSRNHVIRSDATAVPERVVSSWRNAVLYADPPYTKDHYSRFYHVLETLVRYDYPDAKGAGRVRSDRHLSGFCYKSRASDSFNALARLAHYSRTPLVLSYPSDGLLAESGVRAAFAELGDFRLAMAVPYRHSTLGSSKGLASKNVVERIYVFTPSP